MLFEALFEYSDGTNDIIIMSTDELDDPEVIQEIESKGTHVVWIREVSINVNYI